MLESVPVQVNVLVEIVLVSEKVGLGCEDEPLGHAFLGQKCLVRILDLEHLFFRIIHIAAPHLVSEIRTLRCGRSWFR